jgi:hypothetical protein
VGLGALPGHDCSPVAQILEIGRQGLNQLKLVDPKIVIATSTVPMIAGTIAT